LLYYENKLRKQGFNTIIGVDEAGRGPLAGPVVAAAVSLNTFKFRNRIDDSKKLSSQGRENAFSEIIDNSDFGIGIVGEQEIDRLNILVATRLAMQQAIASLVNKLSCLKRKNIHIIIDGNVPVECVFAQTCIIKGDNKSKSIASASILAKVTRDRIMQDYDKIYPQYRLAKHKGYPTKEHKRLIKEFGLSPIHRKSFSCV
jgi:ribonuclease HII